MADTVLEIVSETDEVIGHALRSEIHAKGLLHREIHVLFITPDQQVVFQKRSLAKETNPGLLTTAVGGHVENGYTYLQAALMETYEETGLKLAEHELVYFQTCPTESWHPKTSVHNRSLRGLFGFLYPGDLRDLKIESGDGEGFITFPYERLLEPDDQILQSMSPRLLEMEFSLIKEPLLALTA